MGRMKAGAIDVPLPLYQSPEISDLAIDDARSVLRFAVRSIHS
jgi:hypothetical protein